MSSSCCNVVGSTRSSGNWNCAIGAIGRHCHCWLAQLVPWTSLVGTCCRGAGDWCGQGLDKIRVIFGAGECPPISPHYPPERETIDPCLEGLLPHGPSGSLSSNPAHHHRSFAANLRTQHASNYSCQTPYASNLQDTKPSSLLVRVAPPTLLRQQGERSESFPSPQHPTAFDVPIIGCPGHAKLWKMTTHGNFSSSVAPALASSL